MEKIGNVQDIAIYLDVRLNSKGKMIRESVLKQMDGFIQYYKDQPENEKIIIKNIYDLVPPFGSVVVPGNSYFFPDETFYSVESKIAFKMSSDGMDFWVNEETSWYLPYMIQLLILPRKKTFLHGAGIAINSETGILLVAFGGIGKTCFVANVLKNSSVKLLGDDLIVMDEDGYLYSYPRPFCLYQYHKELFPQFFSGKNFHFEEMRTDRYFLRATRKLKKMLRINDRITYDYIPVSPIHLFSEDKVQIKPVKLQKVFFLNRVKGISSVKIFEAKSDRNYASFAHDIIQHEWSMGIRIEYNYFAHQCRSYADIVQKQYEIIQKGLSKAEQAHCVDIPDNMGAMQVSDELGSIILGDI